MDGLEIILPLCLFLLSALLLNLFPLLVSLLFYLYLSSVSVQNSRSGYFTIFCRLQACGWILCPGATRELKLIQEFLSYTCRGWNREGRLCYTQMNWEWTGPGQRGGSQRHDEHSGKISYYFNRSTSEGEFYQRSASGVTRSWCSKDFHKDQEAANVD